MTISWSISKKRGNHRPVLHYTVTLSDFEKGLCVPAVHMLSILPKPPDAGWSHCWPEQNERGQWTPTQFHYLMTPSHKAAVFSESLKLPWREDNEYPEVEEAFVDLREQFEKTLAAACDSRSMDVHGSLESTFQANRYVAPAFAAQRILQAVKS